MTRVLTASSALFRDRDLFVHDGTKLRRMRVSWRAQALFATFIGLLVAFSSYSLVRFLIPAQAAMVSSKIPAEMVRLAAATEQRVNEIEQRQIILAAMIAGEEVDSEVIASLGYRLPLPGEDGQGGPFDTASQGDPTFKSLFTSLKKLDNIADGAIAVPSEKPVRTAAFQSAFGQRIDPFERRRKKHEGIDLSGPVGTPIYATADGVVSDAGYNSGGYGNLIKIDHGRGIETRYAHLSSIGVVRGQRVTRGQVIARMGSTGRSTGSHLHYEVRIAGAAVDPIPFMKSTDYLLAMQKGGGTHSLDGGLAVGGPKASPK